MTGVQTCALPIYESGRAAVTAPLGAGERAQVQAALDFGFIAAVAGQTFFREEWLDTADEELLGGGRSAGLLFGGGHRLGLHRLGFARQTRGDSTDLVDAFQ